MQLSYKPLHNFGNACPWHIQQINYLLLINERPIFKNQCDNSSRKAATKKNKAGLLVNWLNPQPRKCWSNFRCFGLLHDDILLKYIYWKVWHACEMCVFAVSLCLFYCFPKGSWDHAWCRSVNWMTGWNSSLQASKPSVIFGNALG